MAAIAFDTLALARRLRDEGHFTQEQAEGAARVLSETLSEVVVTRDHFDASIERLDAKFEALMERLDAKFEASMERLDTKLDALNRQSDSKLDALKLQLESNLQTSLAETKAEIVRWAFSALVVQTGLLAAVIKLIH